MKRGTERAIKVGILVFFSLTIFVVFIYFVGSKDNLFRSKISITTSFRDIRGVVVGNNVRFSGINVGKIDDINITSDSTVVLNLSIVSEYAQFIYRDATTEINQDGFVGNKIITITSGNANAGAIVNGSHLQGKEGVDVGSMLYEAQSILTQTKIAANSLNSILQKIDSGDGMIAQLLNSNEFPNQLTSSVKELNSILSNMNNIVKKIDKGDGDIANLINNKELSNQAVAILNKLNETTIQTNKVITDLEKVTQSINMGDGTVNKLLNDKATAQTIDSTIVKLQGSLSEFDKTAKAIQDSWLLNLFTKKKNKTEKK